MTASTGDPTLAPAHPGRRTRLWRVRRLRPDGTTADTRYLPTRPAADQLAADWAAAGHRVDIARSRGPVAFATPVPFEEAP